MRSETAGRLLFVASAGGHLQEMEALAGRVIPAGYTAEWMTAPGPQAERLRSDQVVHLLRPTRPRDLKATVLNVAPVVNVLRARRPSAVLSTGAAVALPALGLARSLGIEAHYIESAARIDAPSLTGRLLKGIPGLHRYSQWQVWDRGWQATGSVFDGFTAVAEEEAARGLQRVVVTLGTQAGYGFRRLVKRLVAVLPPGIDALWQVGSTDVTGLGIDAHRVVHPTVLATAIAKADAVVAHAGVGSALSVLEAGKLPILVPREARHGEHVDDHQVQIAQRISDRGLAIMATAGEVALSDLIEAQRYRVQRNAAGPLALAGRLGDALRTS